MTLRSAAVLALACALLYGAADTTTSTKSKSVPSSKSKSSGQSKAGSKSKTTSKSKTAKSSGHGKTTARSGKTSKTSKTAGKRGNASQSKRAATWRSRQVAPTPERYKEIQSALVQRGYLKKDPSGVWDADSADALRRFQQDQSLQATGKLDSLSLIALGLGPKHPAPTPAPAAPHAAPAQTPVTPPAVAPEVPAPAPETPGPTSPPGV